jgi:hypothetical protein
MSRRWGMQDGGGHRGPPADEDTPSGKRRWLFPAVAGGIALLWVILNLPYKEAQSEPVPYTTKVAGWPDTFARWSVDNDTRKTTYSSFFLGALVFNLVTLAAPIAVAWVVIRQLGQAPEQAEERPRGTRRPVPPPPGVPPPRRPPGGSRSSGGWG